MCSICCTGAFKLPFVVDDFGNEVNPNDEREENGSFFPLRRMASMSAYGFEIDWLLWWWRRDL